MCDGRHKIGASGICYKTVTPKRFPRYFRKLLVSELVLPTKRGATMKKALVLTAQAAPIQVVTTTLQTRSEMLSKVPAVVLAF
jgi:hypothetical protein